jgi:hypothetical protein
VVGPIREICQKRGARASWSATASAVLLQRRQGRLGQGFTRPATQPRIGTMEGKGQDAFHQPPPRTTILRLPHPPRTEVQLLKTGIHIYQNPASSCAIDGIIALAATTEDVDFGLQAVLQLLVNPACQPRAGFSGSEHRGSGWVGCRTERMHQMHL